MSRAAAAALAAAAAAVELWLFWRAVAAVCWLAANEEQQHLQQGVQQAALEQAAQLFGPHAAEIQPDVGTECISADAAIF